MLDLYICYINSIINRPADATGAVTIDGTV